jgi:hypothetical protein
MEAARKGGAIIAQGKYSASVPRAQPLPATRCASRVGYASRSLMSRAAVEPKMASEVNPRWCSCPHRQRRAWRALGARDAPERTRQPPPTRPPPLSTSLDAVQPATGQPQAPQAHPPRECARRGRGEAEGAASSQATNLGRIPSGGRHGGTDRGRSPPPSGVGPTHAIGACQIESICRTHTLMSRQSIRAHHTSRLGWSI